MSDTASVATLTQEIYSSSQVSRRLSRDEMEAPTMWALKHAILVEYLCIYNKWPRIKWTRPGVTGLRACKHLGILSPIDLFYDMSDWSYAYYDPTMFPALVIRD